MASRAAAADLGAVLPARREVERIRVVLSELPRMLRDIVSETIDRQDDMKVVGDLPARADAWDAGVADVVVAGLADDALADRYTRLMRYHPGLKVLGITGDARSAFLFELRPHRIPLGDASPDGLLSAIRAAARCETP
jgi:hypothetical protein